MRASILAVFLALLIGSAGALEAQSGARASLTLFGGFATGGAEALVGGVELRTPELGPLSLAATASGWQFIGVGCDLITGPPCPGESAKGLDVGPVVRLTPAGLSWRLEATARLGGLWYRAVDGGFWAPSAGLTYGFGETKRVSGRVALRYHILTSSPGAGSSYRVGADDHVVVSAGVRLRL